MSTLYFADDIWFIQNIYYNLMFTVVTTLIGFQNQHAVGKKKSNIVDLKDNRKEGFSASPLALVIRK